MTKHAPLKRGEVTTKLNTMADKGDETKGFSLPFSKEENAPMKTQKPVEEHSSSLTSQDTQNFIYMHHYYKHHKNKLEKKLKKETLCFIFEQSSALAKLCPKIIKYLKIENLVMLVYQSGPLFIMSNHNKSCKSLPLLSLFSYGT